MALLPRSEQKRIDNSVDSIFLQTNMSYPKDGLLNIVNALGIKVKVINLGEFSDKVSGVINKDHSTIYLNQDHSPERQTFTLAHELGHYVLHNGVKLRIDKYNYQANTKEAKEETEANYFAASLLMPKIEFMSVIENAGTVGQVAKYFGVSQTAVVNRIRWLRQN